MATEPNYLERHLDRLEERLDKHVEWCTDAFTRLALHERNHHGRASTVKQAGWMALIISLLVGVAEVLRYLVV